MRVLYFSRDYTTHDRHFLVKFAASKHEAWYLRLENDGVTYEKRPLPEGIHAVEWPGGQRSVRTPEEWLGLMPAFESVLERVAPTLVHAGPVQSCGFMTAMSGFRPFLAMSWGSDILVDGDRDDFWRWMTRYTLNRADRLFCDCQAVQDKAQQLAHYPAERIVQFPWGIDLSYFYPGEDTLQLRRQQGWGSSRVVLSTRAWERIYGIDVLLEAFALARARDNRLRLCLLGDGPLAPEVQRLVAGRGLQDAIYSPGLVPHEQLPAYFRAADIYLSCTYSDGTSISLLEALATGMPVVATDGPGNREWVLPGVNGWLSSAGQPAAFADALLTAANMSPAERAEMAQRNRRLAEERANWDINFGKLLAAYDIIEAEYGR